jgi:hypothetical protein
LQVAVAISPARPGMLFYGNALSRGGAVALSATGLCQTGPDEPGAQGSGCRQAACERVCGAGLHRVAGELSEAGLSFTNIYETLAYHVLVFMEAKLNFRPARPSDEIQNETQLLRVEGLDR